MVPWPSKRDRRWASSIVVSAVIALVIAVAGWRVFEPAADSEPTVDSVTIRSVSDGDSMRLTNGERLRLANIDTPEEGEPFYQEATDFLSKMVTGRTLTIEYPERRRDKYGRLLAYCWADTFFVSQQLLRAGLAYLLLFDTSDYHQPHIPQLLAAQREALEERLGLHGLDRTPERRYLATRHGLRFHRPVCSVAANWPLNKIRVFESREEALYEGLAPCRRCRP